MADIIDIYINKKCVFKENVWHYKKLFKTSVLRNPKKKRIWCILQFQNMKSKCNVSDVQWPHKNAGFLRNESDIKFQTLSST